MSADVPAPGSPGANGWEQLLRSMLGPAADEVIEQLRAGGLDPADMPAIPGMPTEPAVIQQVVAQVQRLMAAGGGDPVNWEVAHELARQQAGSGGDPSLGAAERRAVTDAFAVAELWLDAATDLPPTAAPAQAWSRAEWVEATLPTWRTLTEPIATSLVAALGRAFGSTVRDEIGDTPLDVSGMVRTLGQTVFGLQVGQAVGSLARETFGATDIGLPLLAVPAPALVPRNVGEFSEDLGVPADEVRLFLALREAAATRLVTHVPWLRAHLLGAVEAYARGITVDTEQLEEAVRSVDVSDPAALQAALSGGVFNPQVTPDQKAALERLETSLALVEGWVDEVAAAAAAPHLPHTVALREMLRRRRAAGGPAEQTFATLVGLQLRPRRLRDAAALWAAIAAELGPAGRDAVWTHPDLMPNADDLDDPAGYATRRQATADESADLDRALAEILGEQEPPAS